MLCYTSSKKSKAYLIKMRTAIMDFVTEMASIGNVRFQIA